MENKNVNKFKAFYKLGRARRNMEFSSMDFKDFKHLEEPSIDVNANIPPNYEDSFELIPEDPDLKPQMDTESKKSASNKSTHIRSQSCPYITPTFHEGFINNHKDQKTSPKDPLSPESKKLKKLNSIILPFAKRSKDNKPRISVLSQSSQSVVIHNNLANSLSIDVMQPLSSMLYSQKKNQLDRKIIPKVSRKYFQNTGQDQWRKTKYLKIKLQHQIKKYQLNHDLKKLEKETADVGIKQSVLEGILRKSESEAKYLGYQTNQSFIMDDPL